MDLADRRPTSFSDSAHPNEYHQRDVCTNLADVTHVPSNFGQSGFNGTKFTDRNIFPGTFECSVFLRCITDDDRPTCRCLKLLVP